MSDDDKIALCAEIEAGLSVSAAAARTGFSETAVRNWIGQFQDEVKKLQTTRTAAAIQSDSDASGLVGIIHSNKPDDVVANLRAENARLRAENDRIRSAILDPSVKNLTRVTSENERLRHAVVELVLEMWASRERPGRVDAELATIRARLDTILTAIEPMATQVEKISRRVAAIAKRLISSSGD